MSRRSPKKRRDHEADQHRQAQAAFRELTEELLSAGYSHASIARGIQEALQAHSEILERDQARAGSDLYTHH